VMPLDVCPAATVVLVMPGLSFLRRRSGSGYARGSQR
jgi:hypothetical protein